MPRDGSGVYSLPNPPFTTGAVISSAVMNSQLADIATDANTARPVSAGGTGATNAADALTELGALAADLLQTAIDDTTAGHVLTAGAFGWGAPAGAGAPSMVIPSNDYNQAIVAGVYTGAGASAVNGPGNNCSFGPLLVLRRIQTTVVQVASFGSPTNPLAMQMRASGDGGSTWSAWSDIFTDSVHGQTLIPKPNINDDTTDLNTLTTPGWYSKIIRGTAPNGWGNSNYAYLLTLVYNATNITQFAIGYGNGGGQTACYIRQRFSGTWSGWAEIYTSSTGIPWSALLTSPVPSSTTMPVGWSGQCAATASVSSGASTAGSNLKPVGSSVSQSGTWLNLSGGTIAASGFGLFVRTA